MLLETKIIKDDGYQKQQGMSTLPAPERTEHSGAYICIISSDGMLTLGLETLIVWTEPHGTDMALSFQEPEGCAAIW
jgi:protein phosphatase-4 regulatory subunit 3